MAKIILICGKVCSGKSTYANKVKQDCNAVILSCDEITLGLFDGQLGEKHDDVLNKVKSYLYKKAEEIVAAGTNVILDFGFWSSLERRNITKVFIDKGIEIEWHYVEVTEEIWRSNIQKRNHMIKQGLCMDYYIDKNLLEKSSRQFEAPTHEEIDVWYCNNHYSY